MQDRMQQLIAVFNIYVLLKVGVINCEANLYDFCCSVLAGLSLKTM